MNRLTKDLHTPHDDTTYAEVVKDAIDRENIVLTKLKHYEGKESPMKPAEVWENANPKTRCSCSAGVIPAHNYCWNCGQKLDWNNKEVIEND